VFYHCTNASCLCYGTVYAIFYSCALRFR
jgi:hypothetical protein